jgi:chromosome segregation ATPase
MKPESESEARLLAELSEYIATSKKERGSMYEQLRGIGDATQKTFYQLELIKQELQAAIESVRNEFKGLASRVSDLERNMGVISAYNHSQLEKRFDEGTRQAQSVRQIMLNGFVGALITFVGALLALLATYVLKKP